MVVGMAEGNLLHAHPRILHKYRLHAPVLVAGGKYQGRIMVENKVGAAYARGPRHHDSIVGTTILTDHHAQVVEWIAHGIFAKVNVEINLLM